MVKRVFTLALMVGISGNSTSAIVEDVAPERGRGQFRLGPGQTTVVRQLSQFAGYP